MPGGMGGGGGIDLSNAMSTINDFTERGLTFGTDMTERGVSAGEYFTEKGLAWGQEQLARGIRFGKEQTREGLRFAEEQTERGIQYMEPRIEMAAQETKQQSDMAKRYLTEGFDRYQALMQPFRDAGYEALDHYMDSIGVPRINSRSVDIAGALDLAAQERSLKGQLRSSAQNLIPMLPNLSDRAAQSLQYAIGADKNPADISKFLTQYMSGKDLKFDMERDRTKFPFYGENENGQFLGGTGLRGPLFTTIGDWLGRGGQGNPMFNQGFGGGGGDFSMGGGGASAFMAPGFGGTTSGIAMGSGGGPGSGVLGGGGLVDMPTGSAINDQMSHAPASMGGGLGTALSLEAQRNRMINQVMQENRRGHADMMNTLSGPIQDIPPYDAQKRGVIGDPAKNTLIFNPIQSYLADAAQIYSDLKRVQQNLTPGRRALARYASGGNFGAEPVMRSVV